MTIRNTADYYRENPGVALLAAVSEGDSFITNMEAAGQRELVNSDRLPVDTYGTDAAFEALGFTFGQPDKGDELFRPATLPPGWKRVGSDHAMWSKIVDEYNRERVSIFYKAAFYDRRAFMRLATPESYIRTVMDQDAVPVFDKSWLTPEVADAALVSMRDCELTQAREYDGYASEMGRSPENQAELRKITARYRDRAQQIEAYRVRIGGAR